MREKDREKKQNERETERERDHCLQVIRGEEERQFQSGVGGPTCPPTLFFKPGPLVDRPWPWQVLLCFLIGSAAG